MYINTDEPNAVVDGLVQDIRRYTTIFRCKEQILDHYLLCYGTGLEWVDGNLITQFPDENTEFEVSTKYAKRLWDYGMSDNKHLPGMHSRKFSPLFNLPDDISKEWLDLAKYMIYYINKFTPEDFEVHHKAKIMSFYGKHTVGFQNWYQRGLDEFAKLQERTNQLAHDMDISYHSVDVLHDPVKVKEQRERTNKLIKELLDGTDE